VLLAVPLVTLVAPLYSGMRTVKCGRLTKNGPRPVRVCVVNSDYAQGG
jgi:hypothetical protein